MKADPNQQTEAEEILTYLISQDQLTQAKYASEVLDGYKEGNITFLPTYKYDPNTDVYDTSKKQRTPSWYTNMTKTLLNKYLGLTESCGNVKMKGLSRPSIVEESTSSQIIVLLHLTSQYE